MLSEVFPWPVVPLLASTAYGLVALVLLIACANVAGLLVARAEERRHETSMRIALGATRLRLAQQFLSESLVIALAGGASGAALWQWSSTVIRKNPAVVNLGVSAIPEALPLAYCLLLGVTVALLCGIAPAWAANQVSLMPGVRDLQGGRYGRRFTMPRALVSAQVAICFILLSVTAVLALTFYRERMPRVVRLSKRIIHNCH